MRFLIMAEASGLRVCMGFGARVQGLGFRVWGLTVWAVAFKT